MKFFVNELSIHNQYTSIPDFLKALSDILSCKQSAERLNYSLYISHKIGQCVIGINRTFKQVIYEHNDPDLKRLIMLWIDKNGPFVEDNLTRDDGDWYEYNSNIVTESLLGEAVARIRSGESIMMISFYPSLFMQTPLDVIWRGSDSESEIWQVNNFCRKDEFTGYLETYRKQPQTWNEMLIQLQKSYNYLVFQKNLNEILEKEPFNQAIAERIYVLLGILNSLKSEYDEYGERTEKSASILNNYFYRQNALFTDASDSEKNNEIHRHAMTFHLDNGEKKECFWHAKIKHRQFRIHFSYPIIRHDPLYIVYIGPKLTRK